MGFLLPLVKKVNCNQLTYHFIPMTKGQDAPQGVSQPQQAQSCGKMWAPVRLAKAQMLLSLC